MRRVVRFAASGATGALYNAVVPIGALLLLQPVDYGLFSVPYLVYAFGVSLQYSIVSEAWARSRVRGGDATWGEYSSALAVLSVAVGAFAGVLCVAIPELRVAVVPMIVAVLFAVYHSGARYHRLANGSLRRAVLSDVAGLAGLAIGLVGFSWLPSVAWVAVTWLLGGAAAIAVLGLPRFGRGTGLVAWSRRNHAVIRPLLTDSLLMDAGAIGTPFLLAGFMGARDFGVYRAVANVAMPVRLIVEPLRPALGRLAPERLFSFRVTGVLLATGVALSAACYVVLVVVIPWLGIELGTLSALVPYALPASLFVAGNLYGSVYYIICRTNSPHRRIMVGRISQTVLVIALPVLGFVIAGLAGAIWGFAVSSLISSAVWFTLARQSLRDA